MSVAVQRKRKRKRGDPRGAELRRERRRAPRRDALAPAEGEAEEAAAGASGGDEGTEEEAPERGKAKAAGLDHPWPCERSDHCETPPEALRDLARIVDAMARANGVEPGDARRAWTVYDPYYCQGASRRHLVELGFRNVKHDALDAYAEWKRLDGLPACDVLVTNPPFSGTHAERLFRHLHRLQCERRCPSFAVLLPNYVYTKTFYKELYLFDDPVVLRADAKRHKDRGGGAPPRQRTNDTPAACCLFAPHERYAFWSPVSHAGTEQREGKKRRHTKAGLGYRNKPYPCLWYVSLAPQAGEAHAEAQRRLVAAFDREGAQGVLLNHFSKLPNECKDVWDPTYAKAKERRK